MSVGTVTTQVKNLSPGDKFFDQGRWYMWRSIESSHPDDPRRLAYFLEPNDPAGEPTSNGHWVDEEAQVEAIIATKDLQPGDPGYDPSDNE